MLHPIQYASKALNNKEQHNNLIGTFCNGVYIKEILLLVSLHEGRSAYLQLCFQVLDGENGCIAKVDKMGIVAERLWFLGR